LLSGTAATLAVAQTQETALDAQKLVVMVLHNRAVGVVKLNGVPVTHLDSSGAKEGDVVTDSIGTLARWAQNGANVLTIEVRPGKPGYQIETECRIIVTTGSPADLDKPPLFQQTIKGAGAITHNLVLRNVPHWAFQEGEPWRGDKRDVLEAVRALHKAYADHDMKSLTASLRPMFDDMSPVMGPALGNFDDNMREMQQWLKTVRVDPLPADVKLKVESFYGDRLMVVSGEDGHPPIQITSAKIDEQTGRRGRELESGGYWIRRNSRWVLIDQ
jgi:hypothetical protein